MRTFILNIQNCTVNVVAQDQAEVVIRLMAQRRVGAFSTFHAILNVENCNIMIMAQRRGGPITARASHVPPGGAPNGAARAILTRGRVDTRGRINGRPNIWIHVVPRPAAGAAPTAAPFAALAAIGPTDPTAAVAPAAPPGQPVAPPEGANPSPPNASTNQPVDLAPPDLVEPSVAIGSPAAAEAPPSPLSD